MIDFICASCGQFNFDDDACAVCADERADELVA